MIDRVRGQEIEVHIPQPPPSAEPKPRYVYHWDRIFGALAALSLLIGLTGYGLYAWLRPSVPPASVAVEEVPGREEILVEAAQQTVGAEQRGAGEPAVANQPRPAATEAPPVEFAEPVSVQAHAGADIARPALEEAPVRERIAEPATAPIPAPESGAQEPPIAGRELPAEPYSEASTAIATDTPAEVEQVPDSATESSEAMAVAEMQEEASGNGHLRSPNTSISSPAVKRFLLTRSMRGNEPKGTLDDIALNAGDAVTVHSFSEVIGLEGEVLEYRWLHEGKRVLQIQVPVGAKRWRSHSTKRIYPKMKGSWRVELRDSAGQLLASIDFVF